MQTVDRWAAVLSPTSFPAIRLVVLLVFRVSYKLVALLTRTYFCCDTAFVTSAQGDKLQISPIPAGLCDKGNRDEDGKWNLDVS